MAKIPLRNYLKEIENYIEQGEFDQAIAHARKVLQSYPKHIDTYRLLGKAFLESQRYTEAVDILQRVLSVFPDDFVSQIGMSIIREDEGNLDAAIWHMERAYEVQPFNPAVQEELRRLFGRRDGIEPPKIRLTRGALIRMYTRGELYSQATAETRAAIAEDTQRFDLLVLLARLYYLSDQKIEATEVCSTIISKLPYCYEANRILAEILPGTSRAEDARKFQQRLYALDPYAAFISPAAPSSDQVPDQAVMIEQFNWEASLMETQTPEWTRTIGIAWDEGKEEELPDWINALQPDESVPTAFEDTSAEATASTDATASAEAMLDEGQSSDTAQIQEETQSKEEYLPDWMKDAGWKASDRPADEIMSEQDEASEGDIAPAEIPDWLQSIAPEDVQTNTGEDSEQNEWLETLLVTTTSEIIGEQGKEPGLADLEDDQGTEDQQSIPDWLASPESDQAKDEAQGEEVPDWLDSIIDQPDQIEKPEDVEELPGWLTSDETEAADLKEGSTQDQSETMQAWMEELHEQNELEEEQPDLPPDWLQQEKIEDVEPVEKDLQVEADLPDWLQAVGSEEQEPGGQAEEETFAAQLDEEAAALSEAGLAETEIQSAEEDQATGEELPDWLQSFGSDEAAVVDQDEGKPLEVISNQEVDISQEESSEEEPAVSESPVKAFDSDDEDTSMAWLESLATQEDTSITSSEQGMENSSAEVPSETGMPDLSDMAAAMIWLESLAARQGADEATLSTPPELRTETPPDWLQREVENDLIPVETEDIKQQEEQPAVSEDLSEWLQEVAALSAAEAVVSDAATKDETDAVAAETLPEWLREINREEREETIVAGEDLPDEMEAMTIDASEQASLETASIPDEPGEEVSAVHELPSEQPAEDLPVVEGEQPEVEEIPVIEAQEDAVSQAAPEEMMAAVSSEEAAVEDDDMDAAFSWLESLAAKQGADEGTLITAAEERSETPPEWIQQEQAKGETESEPTKAELPETDQELEAEYSAEATGETLTAQEEPAAVEELEPEAPGADASPVEEETEPVEEAVPDWLKDIGEEQPETEQPWGWITEEASEAGEEAPAAPQAEEPAVPVWLQESDEEEPPSIQMDEAEEMPDWLKEIAAEEEEGILPISEIQSAWEPEIGLDETLPQPEASEEAEQSAPASLAELSAMLSKGDLETALEGYNHHIDNGEFLSEIIQDLRDALYRYPVDISLWQALGNAYAQNNQLQEALDAYTKAEELLR